MGILFQYGIHFIQSLQTFSPALDGVMNGFTFLGRVEFYLILIPFIYWVIDRRIGIRAFLILIYTDFTSSSLKLLFHQPRPYWIGGVKELSVESSYGLPSSHASNSLAVGGYLSSHVKQNWVRIVIGIVIFFVAFSRMYLGVHFPQDVLLGWLIGYTIFLGISKWGVQMRNWLADKSLYTQIALGFVDSTLVIVIGALIRIYIAGKADPASWSQYAADARSITHFVRLAGALFGAYAGYPLMRRYARFDPKGAWDTRIIRYVVGIIGVLLIYIGLDVLFSAITPDETTLGYFLRYIRYWLVTFWITFLAPWIFIKTKLAGLEE